MHHHFIEASILHTFNPFIIKLFFIHPNFGIRWYGMAYLTGFVVSYLIILFMAKRGRATIKPELVADFITYAAIGTMVGGRLGYCVFYDPSLFTTFTSHVPFWGVFAVENGGMASHGGMMGIALACYLFARKHKIDILHLGDLCTMGGSVGIFFGRIANFLNGELVGRPAPKNMAWAVKFPQDMYDWPQLAPERLEGLKNIVPKVGVPTTQWESWIHNLRFHQTQVMATIHSLINAIQNGNKQVQIMIKPLLTPRYPSQIYEALMEGLLMFLIVFFVWRKPRKPGIVVGVWICCYAIVRIIGEQFRMPDIQLGYRWLHLTRGQWLSIIMLCIGSVLLWIWSRRPVPAIGGWGSQGQLANVTENSGSSAKKGSKHTH